MCLIPITIASERLRRSLAMVMWKMREAHFPHHKLHLFTRRSRADNIIDVWTPREAQGPHIKLCKESPQSGTCNCSGTAAYTGVHHCARYSERLPRTTSK